MDAILILELLLIIGLLGLSAFFSGSETALFSLNQTQLEQMERDRRPRVALIKRLLNKPRRLIVTILIGNELVNISASVLSTSLIIQWMGGQDQWWINICVMAPILLLFGEITPKTIAVKNNAAFAEAVSPLLESFAWLITPLRTVIRAFADRLTTLLIGKERSEGNIITEDMVRTLAAQATAEGDLDHAERRFINNIFDFGNHAVRELLTPRASMDTLSIAATQEEIVATIETTQHTRLPVFDAERRETVVGILHLRDLVDPRIDPDALSGEGLERLLRKPMFIPESQSVIHLFSLFRQKKTSFALTLDEFGGITGLVTMADLMEAIFGSLEPTPMIAAENPGADDADHIFTVPGDMPVEAFNQQMESALEIQMAETMGGWLLHQFGELPEENARKSADGWDFNVLEVTDNRIASFSCKRRAPRTPSVVEPTDGAAAPDAIAADADGFDADSGPGRDPASAAGKA